MRYSSAKLVACVACTPLLRRRRPIHHIVSYAPIGGRSRLPSPGIGETAGMEIPKDAILKLLRDRGQNDQAAQADQELPDQVDPEQHSGLLSKFGLDPS